MGNRFWSAPLQGLASWHKNYGSKKPFHPESLAYLLNLVSHLSCLHAVVKWTEHLIFLSSVTLYYLWVISRWGAEHFCEMLSTLTFQWLPIKGVQHLSRLWLVRTMVLKVLLITSWIKAQPTSKVQVKKKLNAQYICTPYTHIKDKYAFLLAWRLTCLLDYSCSLCICAYVCSMMYSNQQEHVRDEINGKIIKYLLSTNS